MRTGRPSKGLGHVDGLSGGATEKQRLRAILATLTGELTVEEACRELGIERAYFQELRARALAGALAGLAPRAPGRPCKATQESTAELSQLRHENEELRFELQIEKVRLDLALSGLTRLTSSAPQKKS